MEASYSWTKNTFTPNFTKSPPTQSENLIRIREIGAWEDP